MRVFRQQSFYKIFKKFFKLCLILNRWNYSTKFRWDSHLFHNKYSDLAHSTYFSTKKNINWFFSKFIQKWKVFSNRFHFILISEFYLKMKFPPNEFISFYNHFEHDTTKFLNNRSVFVEFRKCRKCSSFANCLNIRNELQILWCIFFDYTRYSIHSTKQYHLEFDNFDFSMKKIRYHHIFFEIYIKKQIFLQMISFHFRIILEHDITKLSQFRSFFVEFFNFRNCRKISSLC